MTRLVFALGLLLAVGGIAAIVSGAPIIQLERGWAEVIAGTVSLSGGVVTVALGAVLVSLRTLIGTTERLQPGAAVVRPEPVLHLSDDAVEMRPTLAPDEAVYVADAADEAPAARLIEPDESTDRRPWARPAKRDRLADGEPLEAVVPRAIDDEPAADDGQRFAVEADEAVPQAPPESEPSDDAAAQRRLTATASGLPSPAAPPPPPQSSRFRDWRSRPLLRSRAPAPEAPPPLFHGGDGADGEAPPGYPEPAEVDEQSSATAGHPPAFVETPPEPAVIGRYQAGASAYTMYADGSIDVETEGGDRHRFSSMDELKDFIARQEPVVG